jgi:urease accessory protein
MVRGQTTIIRNRNNNPIRIRMSTTTAIEAILPALPTAAVLLRLLQLASSSLPVGAYSYSEGLEFLIQEGKISHAADLYAWLTQGLTSGAVRLELAVMAQVYHIQVDNPQVDLAQVNQGKRQPVLVEPDIMTQIQTWNQWLSAAKETAELQHQSWQMGGSLQRLFRQLEPESALVDLSAPCNFAIAYIMAAAHWQIPLQAALLGYVQSWASNLIGAGIKLIPLGQTQGQLLLAQLQPHLIQACELSQLATPTIARTCGWGLALASMGHETQYSRLFRS